MSTHFYGVTVCLQLVCLLFVTFVATTWGQANAVMLHRKITDNEI